MAHEMNMFATEVDARDSERSPGRHRTPVKLATFQVERSWLRALLSSSNLMTVSEAETSQLASSLLNEARQQTCHSHWRRWRCSRRRAARKKRMLVTAEVSHGER